MAGEIAQAGGSHGNYNTQVPETISVQQDQDGSAHPYRKAVP